LSNFPTRNLRKKKLCESAKRLISTFDWRFLHANWKFQYLSRVNRSGS